MIIGGKEFRPNKTYLMGILNVTPDSFSDGGKYDDISAALFHVEKMIEEGADIIDVGGESTRPGYVKISEREEITRVTDTISEIKRRFDIPVSLDTYKTPVAKAGIDAGADLINDIWGAMHRDYPDMAALIRDAGIPCVLMHNKDEDQYSDYKQDLINELKMILDHAIKEGIPSDKIILDPGVGFAKNTEENLMALNLMDEYRKFPVPFLIGASRKSVIGNYLNLPVDERLEGTLAITALSVIKGMNFVRVHDIKENRRVIDMLGGVLNGCN